VSTVYMRTSGEKLCISEKAERVKSVSYSHIRSLSGVCLKFKGRQAKHLPRTSLFMAPCKVCRAWIFLICG